MGRALPPGPGWPRAVQMLAWWTRPIPFLERCRARFGKRFTLRLMNAPRLVILSDPEELRELFTAPPDVLHPGEGARVLEPVVGRHSLILLDEDEHLEQRKLLLPAFHGERMERLTAIMREVAEREVERWPHDESTALHPRLQALTLEIILRAVFGLERGERLEALRAQLTRLLSFGDNPLSLMPLPETRHGPYAWFVKLRDAIDRQLFELIDERRRAGAEDRGDVLSMLLSARHEDGSPMSAQELRDELMTLLVAGHETTASELAWAFERFQREPAVLERLRDEPDDEYLNAVVHETLRRRPVLPIAANRLVKKPVEIGGVHYEPGTELAACSYLVHHDPDVYPEPYAFRPERFLDEKPGTYTWIPFGGGRRRCIGASFAQLEMRVVLRAVLERREVAPAAGAHERSRRRQITLSPASGAEAVLVARASA